MTQCPDHPRLIGASLGNCRACDTETTPPPADWRPAPTRAPRTHTRPTPERPSLDATRARADEEQK
jgi:hypothetical protein